MLIIYAFFILFFGLGFILGVVGNNDSNTKENRLKRELQEAKIQKYKLQLRMAARHISFLRSCIRSGEQLYPEDNEMIDKFMATLD